MDITQNIRLDKVNYTTNEYVSKLETHINKLENIIQEQNLIIVEKILKIESSLNAKGYKIQINSITDEYTKFPSNTKTIEIIYPKTTPIDATDIKEYNTNSKKITYEFEFNSSIEPNQVFKNLKKLVLSNIEDLQYFCSVHSCKLTYSCNQILNVTLYNNNLEEIIFCGESCQKIKTYNCSQDNIHIISLYCQEKNINLEIGEIITG